MRVLFATQKVDLSFESKTKDLVSGHQMGEIRTLSEIDYLIRLLDVNRLMGVILVFYRNLKHSIRLYPRVNDQDTQNIILSIMRKTVFYDYNK